MAAVRNLKQKVKEEQQKAVHYKNLYANAAMKLDGSQGCFNRKAADKLERAVKQIATGTSLIREVINDLQHEVLPTSERDKLRHHLKRAAAGIGLKYVQDPKKRCTTKDLREMPALSPADEDKGKKDLNREEDESEDEEETEDSEDDQNGTAPMSSWQDYYGSTAVPMYGNFGQVPQHSYYDWSNQHQWQQQSQQQQPQQQHGFGTHKKAD